MNIKEFNQVFIDRILGTISKQGFNYKKSRKVFECVNGEHLFFVFVYMYKRSTFIEIETKAFYGNKGFTTELKSKGIKLPYKHFCGGQLKFLSEYYLKKDFPEKYSNLIFMLNEEPECVVKDWLDYFDSIILPFLEDCKNPKLLNDIVNNIPIDKVGLNATYQTRVFYSYFVGKRAGLKNDELLKLATQYEEELKSWGEDCNYLDEYLSLKKELF
ncbi:hypothetical protein KLA_15690 [Cellulophaga geojensis KL-A]|uniref:DUF4304 domain-containing protein n=1 Tax=Cellulophaga geojensis KL-A TaxID=1328323 RepID=A0ABN0RK52_9FLAO|nr:hypothetical protein [Cellulophaga geojensis]EWH11453.1 hypothetical protein KLA_15690 [Cellulophaga geojensis KL-A]